MKKQSEQLLIHVAPPLKKTVAELAAADGRSISDYVRRLVIDVVTQRVVERSHVGL
jgi:hypothetical protein